MGIKILGETGPVEEFPRKTDCPICGAPMLSDASYFYLGYEIPLPPELQPRQCIPCDFELELSEDEDIALGQYVTREYERLTAPVAMVTAETERPVRKAISKRLRFEVFKRDGFKCIYCGASPVDGALHVDHVDPVVAGGKTEPANLVTACAGCNLGKSSVPLSEKRLATGRITEADKDHAEQIREYLAVQREVSKARTAVVDSLAEHWESACGELPRSFMAQMPKLAREWDVAKLFEAIDIVASRMDRESPTAQYRYFYGVLRVWRRAAGGE